MNIVNYEIAKKLKEKGFREECLLHYTDTGSLFSNSIDTYDRPNQELDYSDFQKCFNNGNSIGLVDAPTISQVLKWLRDIKGLHIEIFLCIREYSYFIKSIDKIDENGLFHEWLNEDTTDEEHDSYEQAALAGIEYAIDNLI